VTDPNDPSLADLTDEQLVARANRGGDEGAAAFETLYERHKQWVMNLALRFTRDRNLAADVTQEVFIYFLGKFPGFELTARLTTFLYPAVKNVAIAQRGKAQRHTPGSGGGTPGDALLAIPDGNPTDPAEANDRCRAELAEVFSALSEAHREVVLMRFVDGFSLAEIGEALGVPVGTVKSRLHHALAALRQDERTRQYFEQM